MALGVVEIRGHRNDGLRDFLAEIGFGGFLHLAEDEGADLAGRIFLAAGFNPCVAIVATDDGVGDQALVLGDGGIFVAAADQAFDRVNRVGGVGDGLALGGLADEAFTVIGESNHAGGCADTFAVLDHADIFALHDRDAGIGGAQVDTDDLAHMG